MLTRINIMMTIVVHSQRETKCYCVIDVRLVTGAGHTVYTVFSVIACPTIETLFSSYLASVRA